MHNSISVNNIDLVNFIKIILYLHETGIREVIKDQGLAIKNTSSVRWTQRDE